MDRERPAEQILQDERGLSFGARISSPRRSYTLSLRHQRLHELLEVQGVGLRPQLGGLLLHDRVLTLREAL